MSQFTRAIQSMARDRSSSAAPADEAAERSRGRAVLLLIAIALLGWSITELISLGLTHTTGPELYGVLVAAVAVGAAALNVALFASSRSRVVATIALAVLWAVIALSGVAGSVAHLIGPVADHGPVDLRPRPVAAPLVFTAIGVVGELGLFVRQRMGARGARKPGEE